MIKNEELYRKWIGICEKSGHRPLVLTTKGELIKIHKEGRLLLELSKSEYDDLTVNEIVELLGN